MIEETEEEERYRVRASLPTLPCRKRRHHFHAGAPQQLRHRYDLISAIAQGLNQHRQRRHRRRAIATAIMHQNDRATPIRMRFHIRNLLEDAIGNLLRGLFGMLIPVVGIDLVADNRVAQTLNTIDRGSLVVRIRLLIDGVRRAEVERLHPKFGAKQALRQIELQVYLRRRDFADVRVGEGVIANLVAFVINPLHDADVILRHLADHKEGALHIEFRKHVQNARSPNRVGPVVKGQRHFIGMVAITLHRVGQRIQVHALLRDHLQWRGNLVVVIHCKRPMSEPRLTRNSQNVPHTLIVDIEPRFDHTEFLHRIDPRRRVPDLPQRVVFRTQLPERKRLNPQRARGPHLVEDRNRIQKPDLVPKMGIVIHVGKVRV